MSEVVERALSALLLECGEKPWREVTLRGVAARAGLTLADLYAEAPSKTALVDHLAARLDDAALATAQRPSDDVHDALFDAVMARIEAMGEWRAILSGVGGSAVIPLLPHLPRAARAMLEAAGVEATAPRLAAMTAVWARIVQVWRADEGALNRTMAEIDKRLKDMRAALTRIGAGF
ncbi:MAG TPA: TetR family transcriptional regulator [Caulobacteraceae bacterium]|nr:TetR family transcriptional regulator [Caulobacteraceae bacterium]